MPENIEIKARAKDFPRQCQLAGKASGSSGEIILQEDTFFDVERGRLKLRTLSAHECELIYYERSDLAAPRKSEYFVAQSSTPASLATVLCATLNVRGAVKKRRTLYKAGQTRIHMDEVEGLGCFIEVEVVLERGQDELEGKRIAQEFMDRLEISEEDLVAEAYVDLLISATSDKRP